MNKQASVFRIFKRHFDNLFRDLETVKKSIERREDTIDQYHLKELDAVYTELEDIWQSIGMSLQMQEDDLL